ncbi:MAG: LamG-like jellyroll fold domain-containing protein [Candidatus Veblenbacteria bacterium]|nr:LamG-like jellyroll fold domain-containing protein [Candidatus Veblenbacteria bacterium]
MPKPARPSEPAPVRRRRVSRGALFTASCWVCGKEVAVSFKPDRVRPVYCSAHLRALRRGTQPWPKLVIARRPWQPVAWALRSAWERHGVRVTAVTLVLLVAAGVLLQAVTGRASTMQLYPTACLGDWYAPQNAAGAPNAVSADGFSQYNDTNSAIYNGGEKQLYCSNFTNENPLPDSTQAEAVRLRLYWAGVPQGQTSMPSSAESVNGEAEPVPESVEPPSVEAELPEPSVDTTNTAPEEGGLLPEVTEPSGEPVSFLDRLVPSARAQTEPEEVAPELPPEDSPAETSSVVPEEASADSPAGADLPAVQESELPLFHLRLALGGTEWQPLVDVPVSVGAELPGEVVLPLSVLDNLEAVQIALVAPRREEASMYVYLDALAIEVDYKTDLFTPLRQLVQQNDAVATESLEMPANLVFNVATTDFAADEDVVFDLDYTVELMGLGYVRERSASAESDNLVPDFTIIEEETTPATEKEQSADIVPEPGEQTSSETSTSEESTIPEPSEASSSPESSAPTETPIQIEPPVPEVVPAQTSETPPATIEPPVQEEVPISVGSKPWRSLVLIAPAAAADTKIDIVSAQVTYQGAQQPDLVPVMEEVGASQRLKLPRPSNSFRPGAYHLVVELTDGQTTVQVSQDFTWGVLAINTNKSVYQPGETAYLQMAALDDAGHTLCEANLQIAITSPAGEQVTLLVSDGSISLSPTCGPDNVTDEPDYFARYPLAEAGTYRLTLTNLDTGHGITGEVEVWQSVPYVVERVGATRINPFKSKYRMTLLVTALDGFNGELREVVPEGFEVEAETGGEVRAGEQGSVVAWRLELEPGENAQVAYVYQAPEESPQFYLLGPAELGEPSFPLGQFFGVFGDVVFNETRQWQLASDAAWYSASWSYRVKVTVQNAEVDADLTNFPVYVNLANLPAGFHTNVNQTDARDIRVTKSDGTTELAREVVFYTAASDTGELHFLANSLANASDTDFYIYYGNAGASDYGVTDTYGRNAVWAGYVGVFHFNESSGGAGAIIDSSGTGNDATDTNSPTFAQAGQLGKSIYFNGGTTFPYIRIGSTSLSLTDFTISSWMKLMTGTTENNEMLDYIAGTAPDRILIRPIAEYLKVNGTTKQGVVTADNRDAWHYFALTKNNSTPLAEYFRDAISVTTFAFTAGASDYAATYAGARSYHSIFYEDELRIRTTVSSDEWLAAEYSNQNTPTTFYAVGAEETPLRVQGVVYMANESTLGTSGNSGPCDGSTAVISIRINGGTAATGSCNATTAAFDITAVSAAASGDTITVYLTSTMKANTVYVSDGNADTGIDLYENTLVVGHVNAGPATILDLLDYDSTTNNTDMLFDAVDATPDTLTVEDGVELHVRTAETLTPGGTVTTSSSSNGADTNKDGDIHIDGTGTLSMGTNTLSVGGDFNNEGTFSKSTGQTTTFTAAATGHTITDGGENFDSVAFNGSGGPWYSSSWPYRVKVTIQNTEVDADLTSFPVYVNLANLPAGFHTNVNQTDARDIRVTKADGTTELAREVMFYTAASDTGELHFLADALSNASDTDFYIYYGNAAASDYAVTDTYGRNAVWGDYEGVWHLNEASSTRVDSSGNGNDMTDNNTVLSAAGKLAGNGADFETSVPEYLSRTDANLSAGFPGKNGTTPAALTVSWWFKLESFVTTNVMNMIAKNATTENPYFGYVYPTAGNDFRAQLSTTIASAADSVTSAGVWYRGALVWDGADAQTYIDGVASGSSVSVSSVPTNTGSLWFGTRGSLGTTRSMDGVIDEIRIQVIDRSADWEAAEYSNQSASATFYSVGEQEGAWYNASWDYRVKVTIQNGEVDADLTSFPVYVNLANLPAGFHTNVNQTDARDIGVTKADGTTELAREVVFYTAASDTGELHFLADSLSNTVDTDFYIYYGNAAASDYAVTDTYGRNAVWANHLAVYHLADTPTGSAGDITDSSGNGKHMTSVNMDSGNVVAGAWGTALAFNGTDEYALIAEALNATLPASVTAIVKPTDVGAATERYFFSTAKSTDDLNEQVAGIRNTDTYITLTRGGAPSAVAESTIDMTDDAYAHVASVWTSATSRAAYLDGANKGTNTTSKTAAGLDRSAIGVRARSSLGAYWEGEIDEIRLYDGTLSDQWIAAEASNQNTPTTFYSVGSVDGSSGGWSFADSTTIDVDLTLTAGTLSGTQDLTVNGGDVTGDGDINLTGGTFLLDGASTTGFGGATAWDFNNLTLGDGTGTTTTTAIGAGGVTVAATLTIAANQTLDMNTNDPPLDVNGAVSISGTLTASQTAVFSVAGDFTNNGTFNNSSGTVTFDGAGTSTFNGSSAPAITFHHFTSTTAGKVLSFTEAKTFRINGVLTIRGSSGNQITIRSTSASNQWLINHQGTESVQYAAIYDSGCDGSSTYISLDNTSSDGDGNNGTCWLFPSLSFTLSSTSASLDLNSANTFTTTASTTLTVTARSAFGYQGYAKQTDNLRHTADAGITIADWTGTNASPTVFNETCIANGAKCGWGYNTNDAGLTQFVDSTYYAGFVQSTTGPGDIVATASGPVSSDATIITYRASVAMTQAAGPYQTTVVYIVTPQF